jgi:hypothetical protein
MLSRPMKGGTGDGAAIQRAWCHPISLVGGTSLAVDAVGVDLEQDGDAVAGVAVYLGSGHAGVQPQ